MKTQISAVVGGILFLVALATAATITARVLPVDALILAIALGIFVTNTVGTPDALLPGVETRKLWLETGIVLMGSRLTLGPIIEAGPRIIGLVVIAILFTGLLTELLARRFIATEEKLGSLLAAGSSVCGVSAIIAVSGGIRADEDQIAYAVATILLFDALTVFAYPLLGSLLDLPAQVFGVWAGLSMFSTAPVVAAGFAYSDVAGQWATLTKITRNLFIAVVAVGYSIFYAQRSNGDTNFSVTYLWEKFPKFLFGFLVFVLLANTGALSAAQRASLETAYQGLFLVAFVGLGLSIKTDDLRRAGSRPVVLVGVVLLIVSSVSLVVSSLAFM